MSEHLQALIAEHLASPFPVSVEKGSDYGEVEPVLIDADIYTCAVQAARGEAIDRGWLQRARGRLARSLEAFPPDAQSYYRRLVNLADEALSQATDDQ